MLWRLMRLWLNMDSTYEINKADIARSFGRAASTYDGYAGLQQKVGHQLMSRLPESAYKVMDLGCGTGFFTPHLAKHFTDAEMIGLDIAQGMLDHCQQQHGDLAQWICGDAENLPLADNSLDVIFSSLAIQWCHQFPNVLSEALRVLKPGGSFVFSTLGPKTLFELRDAWSHVDNYQHVNRFVPVSDMQQAINEAGYSATNVAVEYEIQQYKALKELTTELKKLGAHNLTQGRNTHLTGSQRIKGLLQAYEQHRQDGWLPATYEVVYGVLVK